jgi:hypothetical protein
MSKKEKKTESERLNYPLIWACPPLTYGTALLPGKDPRVICGWFLIHSDEQFILRLFYLRESDISAYHEEIITYFEKTYGLDVIEWYLRFSHKIYV